MRRLIRQDDGSTTIIVVVLLPVLLAVFALASGTAVVAGGERELQRAASASALTAASRMTLLDTAELNAVLAEGSVAVGDEITVTPGDWADLGTLTDPLLGHPGQALVSGHACGLAADNLSTSPMITGFSDVDGQCMGTAIDAPARVRVRTAPDVLGPSIGELQDLLASLPVAIGVDLERLLPSIVSPRVRVDVHSRVQTPLAQLLQADPEGEDIHVTALARRRVKNAVVLPTTSILCSVEIPLVGLLLPSSVTIEGTLDELIEIVESGSTALLDGLLGGLLGSLGLDQALAGLTDLVTDDLLGLITGSCELDPNAPLDSTRDLAFDLLDELGSNPLLEDLLAGVGLSSSCLTSALTHELRDIVDPLGDGDNPPSLEDIVASAAELDEPVMVYLTGVTATLGIPILDAIPVTADHLVNGQLQEATSVHGLYRATLIEESPFDASPSPFSC